MSEKSLPKVSATVPDTLQKKSLVKVTDFSRNFSSCPECPALVSQLSLKLHELCKQFPKIALSQTREKYDLTVVVGLLDGTIYRSSESLLTYRMASSIISKIYETISERHNQNIVISFRFSLRKANSLSKT